MTPDTERLLEDARDRRPERMSDRQFVTEALSALLFLLAATVLADGAFGLGLATGRVVLVWITGALTLLSLAAYLRAWFLHMTSYDSTREDGPDR